jgi:hypothetical protein
MKLPSWKCTTREWTRERQLHPDGKELTPSGAPPGCLIWDATELAKVSLALLFVLGARKQEGIDA